MSFQKFLRNCEDFIVETTNKITDAIDEGKSKAEKDRKAEEERLAKAELKRKEDEAERERIAKMYAETERKRRAGLTDTERRIEDLEAELGIERQRRWYLEAEVDNLQRRLDSID